MLLQCWNRTRYPRHVSRDSQGELKLWDATESELRNRREECRRRALLAHGISEPRIIGSEEFVDHVSCSVELIRKTSVRSVLNSVSTIEESSRQNSWRYSPRRRTEPVYLKSDCCAKSHFAVAEYIANEGMFRSLVRDEVNLWWKRRKTTSVEVDCQIIQSLLHEELNRPEEAIAWMVRAGCLLSGHTRRLSSWLQIALKVKYRIPGVRLWFS